MLAKEIERVGIPAVLITALPSVARSTLAQRVVQGKAVITPAGNHELLPDEEKQWRRKLVEKALQLISSEIKGTDD